VVIEIWMKYPGVELELKPLKYMPVTFFGVFIYLSAPVSVS
jgi:hypothetical protein